MEKNLGPLSLRLATGADEGFLREVHAGAREDLALLPLDAPRKAALMEMQYQAQQRSYREHHGDADFLIIQRDGCPLGRLCVARTAKEIRVLDISLLPQWRDAGVGSSVLNSLLAEADATHKPVRLQVRQDNPARRLYERLGFAEVADDGVYLRMERTPAKPAVPDFQPVEECT